MNRFKESRFDRSIHGSSTNILERVDLMTDVHKAVARCITISRKWWRNIDRKGLIDGRMVFIEAFH